MFGSGTIRTGIDLGTGAVKIVRGEGKERLLRVTHAGSQAWDSQGSRDEAGPASALEKLLTGLGLGRAGLGRIAVAIGGEESSIREVTMPVLTEEELRRALPFESRKHLFLENMADPVIDCQILGSAPPDEENGAEQMRVMLAGVPRKSRDFPVRVLAHAGLEAEVVDLEPLAGLNALLSLTDPAVAGVAGLLDLGGRQAFLHVTHTQGGFLSRAVGPGTPDRYDVPAIEAYAEELGNRLRETMTFYRGRFRQEISNIYLSGGGALLSGVADHLQRATKKQVAVLDPFASIGPPARITDGAMGEGPRFVVAYGLCRWWDNTDV